MSIKNEFNNFKEADLWSFMLFVLFKIREVPEYSGISELAYVLDKKNFLSLCEYFGGLTIKIPTIDEMEILLYGLLLYQYVEVDKIGYDEACELLQNDNVELKDIRSSYNKLKNILGEYQLSPRGAE